LSTLSSDFTGRSSVPAASAWVTWVGLSRTLPSWTVFGKAATGAGAERGARGWLDGAGPGLRSHAAATAAIAAQPRIATPTLTDLAGGNCKDGSPAP